MIQFIAGALSLLGWYFSEDAFSVGKTATHWSWVNGQAYGVVVASELSDDSFPDIDLTYRKKGYPVNIHGDAHELKLYLGPYTSKEEAFKIAGQTGKGENSLITIENPTGRYYVQLYALTDPKSAIEIRLELAIAFNTSAWIYKTDGPDGPFYKIWLGFFSQKEAQEIKNRARKIMKIEGLIRKFNPKTFSELPLPPERPSNSSSLPQGKKSKALSPNHRCRLQTLDVGNRWPWLGTVGYAVQVSSNKDFNTSAREARELHDLGYRPYLEPFHDKTRVRVGPFLTKPQAEQEAKKLGLDKKNISQTFVFPNDYHLVQVKATRSYEVARKFRDKLVANLRKTGWIDEDGRYFRVWLGFYQDEHMAQEVCLAAKRFAPDCFIGVIRP